MDLFEKLFQKISQREFFKKRPNAGLLQLRDIAKYLDVFANSLSQNSIQIQCVASRGFVGLNGAQLFLPEKLDYFEAPTLNKKLYQNLILQIMGAHRLNLVGLKIAETSMSQRLRFLEHSCTINLHLDSLFSGYQSLQNDLLDRVLARARPGNEYYKQVFNFWRACASSRVPVNIGAEALIQSARSQDAVPEFLFLTVPCLERISPSSQKIEMAKESLRQRDAHIETEVEKTYSGINQEVDLDKEKANPLMHSFEKLETADEYSGGRTMDSGDDELNEHSAAIDELNLTKFTRGGEATKSIFNAEAFFNFEFLQRSLNKELAKGHLYPEWNFKKNIYLNDHCHLVENPIKIANGSDDFRNTLLAKNRFLIRHWQSKIQTLFSEPLWSKKLTEGDEIDIDEFIRDLSTMLCGQNIAARWYMNRKKQLSDVEIVILFDQSQSSDSWVRNRRVLDTSLEAVGIAGLLFDNIFETVTVAGIWSATRHACSFQVYKGGLEPWSAFFSKKDAIHPQGYTRLGPAIRHATRLLMGSAHKKKLIILLTDGKPTDVDGYEGAMGIRDVAQACREAEVSGILHYAIVLDHKQKAHYGEMFKHYVLLHDPQLFSEELFRILFRLIRLQ